MHCLPSETQAEFFRAGVQGPDLKQVLKPFATPEAGGSGSNQLTLFSGAGARRVGRNPGTLVSVMNYLRARAAAAAPIPWRSANGGDGDCSSFDVSCAAC